MPTIPRVITAIWRDRPDGCYCGCIFTVLLTALLAGCRPMPEQPAPPRLTDAPGFPVEASTLSAPLTISIDALEAGLERATPRQLWSIDERRPDCIAAQQVKLFGARIKVTPRLGCRIVGQVTRGRLRLEGSGRRLTLLMPIDARVSARNVLGVLRETATAKAMVRADVRFSIDGDWVPRASVAISHDWVEPPGVDFLGQRIRFTRPVDEALAGLIKRLERDLQAEVARVDLRKKVEGLWRQGFAVIQLNRERPPAWLAVTPKGLGIPGYVVDKRRLRFNVVAHAQTATYVGRRPETPRFSPLPLPLTKSREKGARIFIPVLADYEQIEPVILRALNRLAARGVLDGKNGKLEARFEKVTAYATEGNRLAVGIEAEVQPVGRRIGPFGKTRGTVWLTGKPLNAPNSQMLEIEDLQIYGDTDRNSANVLLQLANSDRVRTAIATSLRTNFKRDYDRVLEAARKALSDRQEGRVHVSVSIDKVEHGLIRATGQGLFLPVTVMGRAQFHVGNPDQK